MQKENPLRRGENNYLLSKNVKDVTTKEDKIQKTPERENER